ncbi:hypothetical protein GCM10010123_05880 [Pilimelia anulata]|uniref:Uncharacterized protein n=1 Tax=Pilimelia anulata TaxID=53371 RepID=A0A8J3B7I5_9ACTN|nr:hypothetical protein [Pilimelia anulata]GGJ78777.1 hypothetical protein GCM10010123_05880 [Pilimelia anulata]
MSGDRPTATGAEATCTAATGSRPAGPPRPRGAVPGAPPGAGPALRAACRRGRPRWVRPVLYVAAPPDPAALRAAAPGAVVALDPDRPAGAALAAAADRLAGPAGRPLRRFAAIRAHAAGESLPDQRRRRLDRLMETATARYVVPLLLTVAGVLMQGANGRDTVWSTGWLLVSAAAGLLLVGAVLHSCRRVPLRQVWRPFPVAWRWRAPEAGALDAVLARALLLDVREVWSPGPLRRAMTRFWPGALPVLLLPAGAEVTDLLLRQYADLTRRRGPLRRRACGVLLTDGPAPPGTPPGPSGRREPAWLAGPAPAAPRPPAPERWLPPAAAGRCAAARRVLAAAGRRCGRAIGRRYRTRWVAAALALALPAGAGLAGLGAVYVAYSDDWSYCRLGAAGGSVAAYGEEWIGYRYCRDTGTLPGRAARRLARAAAAAGVPGIDAGPPEHPGLFDVDLIHAENKRVDDLLTRHADRAAVTILLITSLTRLPGSNRSLVAEREALAGAYAAQRRLNAVLSRNQPYLRLAIANAGDATQPTAEAVEQRVAEGAGREPAERAAAAGRRTAAAREAARTALLRDFAGRVDGLLHRDDAAVIGAMVTIESRAGTLGALRVLDRSGLVMASPTMPVDGFGAKLPYFFQVTSTNADQVRLVRAYAARHAPGQSIVAVHPATGAGDLYVASLRRLLDRRGKYPDRHVTWQWSAGRDGARNPLSGACAQGGKRPVVFFTGRYTAFADFVRDLHLTCGADLPLLVAADSASRFLADPALAAEVPHGTEVLIAHRGELLTCARLRATDAGSTDGAKRLAAGRQADFRQDLQEYLGRCRGGANDADTDVWLAGGWAASGYDTVRMLNDAMLRNRPAAGQRLTAAAARELRDAIRRQLAVTDPADGYGYPGAYGLIRFGADRVARRQVTLYRIPELSEAFRDGPASATAVPVGTCRPGPAPPGPGGAGCVPLLPPAPRAR